MDNDNYAGEMRPGTLVVRFSDQKNVRLILENAKVILFSASYADHKSATDTDDSYDAIDTEHARVRRSDRRGVVTFEGLPPGQYSLKYGHFPKTARRDVSVHAGCVTEENVQLDFDIQVQTSFLDQDCRPTSCARPRRDDLLELEIVGVLNLLQAGQAILIPARGFKADPSNPAKLSRRLTALGPQRFTTRVLFAERGTTFPYEDNRHAAAISLYTDVDVEEAPVQRVNANVTANLTRTGTAFTDDLPLWTAILNGTERLSFNNYLRFMNSLFCGEGDPRGTPEFDRFQQLRQRRLLPFTDTDAYRVVKAATEAFVAVNCGVLTQPQLFNRERDEAYFARRDLPLPNVGLDDAFEDYLVEVVGGEAGDKTLPYLALIRSKLPDIAIKFTPFEDSHLSGAAIGTCQGILQEKLTNPCLLELLWSYWHEEGMLVQTINAITRRFQNVRGPGSMDPLSNLEIDPLRPLNNLLWGYLQDEQHRLTVVRRNYEYDHHYGLRLQGKAVRDLNAADTRSKFLEAFHNLLRLCTEFFKQDDDTTVKADAFPVLNALKEIHLILSQGAHNQFGDLPSTARIEMLLQQFLLARPEFREFLPTRIMVAYPEPWMDRVDAMKKLQTWTDTSVLDFRNLAVFGEQVLLSIRFGNWSDVQDPLQAFNWARFFRPQIQGYTHAYRAATGVDLTAATVGSRVDATLPSLLLQRQLISQRRA